ncbi:MAG: hypothetical protein CMJ25_13570 [Phycisphaerae bacterium]|nr:hypothetical protein [Phycisphaerae bacterium]
MENLKLWSAVEKTNPAYTKKANVKGNRITSIAPQYQMLNATEQFGTYGKAWGFKDIELDYSLVDKGLIVFKGQFFYPEGQFPIINSIGLYKDNAQTKIDDDFAKKVETDALTKALSKLGFNADIFMGKFDDCRYVAEITAEFNKPEPNENDKGWIEGIKSGNNKLEEIQDPVYKMRIELFIKEGY